MPRRRAFTLIEVVIATTLAVAVLLAIARSSTVLITIAGRSARWRRASVEVEDLLRRFRRAPCAMTPASPAQIRAGGITFRWSIGADSGRLSAIAWPGDAPAAVRRGTLRSVLPCP